MAQIVKRVMNTFLYPSTHLCAYRSEIGTGLHVTLVDINAAVKLAAIALCLNQRGYNINRVGSHSLRSGSAMAMHLNDIGVPAIKKLGWWLGDTCMAYMHE